MVSEGMYVLCYNREMKLVAEIGPYADEAKAFAEMRKRKSGGKHRHVEVAERVKFK
jgi:hypothetical protein